MPEHSSARPSAPPAPPLAEPLLASLPRHLVVARLSAMGDVALVTGVLLHWHRDLDLTFTVLTKAAFAPLFDRHPAVREVIALEDADLRGQKERALFRRLAAAYQNVPLLDLHGTLRTRMLACFWKGPVLRYPKLALERRLFLHSGGRLCREKLLSHNVPQRYALTLPSPSGEMPSPLELRPHFFLSPAETEAARVRLEPLRVRHAPGAPLVALHPFATHAAKSWPLSVWQELAALLDKRNIPYFWVGRGELPFVPSPFPSNFVNQTGLRDLLGLLSQADLLITGDSGPMHLADGVETPVLALFGPTCREWGFFPSGAHDRVLQAPLPCRPCSLHGKTGCAAACMAALSPTAVVEDMEHMLHAGLCPAPRRGA